MATLQFLSGMRRPAASAASDSSAETKMPCKGEVIDEQDYHKESGANRDNPMHGVASEPKPGICSVGCACAAFHEAQDALVASANGCDDMDSGDLSELQTRRNETFQQVREMAALTRCAVQAKLSVLSVVGHWFGENSPDVCGFAMDVAFEAAALLDSDPGQACSCHPPKIGARLDQAGPRRESIRVVRASAPPLSGHAVRKLKVHGLGSS